MGDILQNGLEWLDKMRNDHMASPVTYRRGQGQATVNATLGKTDYETSDESGFTVRAHTNDFLIRAIDLMIGDDLLTPQVGDQITIVRNGTSLIFEVLSLPGEGCFRFSDPFGQTLRIHTKQVT
jgi:hypothetical protein